MWVRDRYSVTITQNAAPILHDPYAPDPIDDGSIGDPWAGL
jgi:hypothetical protein